MAIDLSTKTDAELLAMRTQNADYELVGSIEKAKTFYLVCDELQIRIPQRARHGGVGGSAEIEHDTRILQTKIDRALAYIRANDPAINASGGGSVLAEQSVAWR